MNAPRSEEQLSDTEVALIDSTFDAFIARFHLDASAQLEWKAQVGDLLSSGDSANMNFGQLVETLLDLAGATRGPIEIGLDGKSQCTYCCDDLDAAIDLVQFIRNGRRQ